MSWWHGEQEASHSACSQAAWEVFPAEVMPRWTLKPPATSTPSSCDSTCWGSHLKHVSCQRKWTGSALGREVDIEELPPSASPVRVHPSTRKTEGCDPGNYPKHVACPGLLVHLQTVSGPAAKYLRCCQQLQLQLQVVGELGHQTVPSQLIAFAH